jgi:membrane protease subunit (stomatin/prohibitin family)
MLFGEYTFRVLDPVRFINDMVGTKGDGERVQKWLADKLMERLRSCLVEWMTGGYFSIATAPGAGPGLAQAVAARAGDFAEYGLELVSIDSVTVQPR